MRVAVLEGVVEGLSAVVEEVRGKARPMIIDEVDWQTGEITPAIAVCILPTKEEPC